MLEKHVNSWGKFMNLQVSYSNTKVNSVYQNCAQGTMSLESHEIIMGWRCFNGL